MYKHRATMTDRRHQILILMAKGYKNKQIARKMGLSLSNTRMQKWRLYCFLGEECKNGVCIAFLAKFTPLLMLFIWDYKWGYYIKMICAKQ